MVLYRSPEIQFHMMNQSWPLYKKVTDQHYGHHFNKFGSTYTTTWVPNAIYCTKIQWYQSYISEEAF